MYERGNPGVNGTAFSGTPAVVWSGYDTDPLGVDLPGVLPARFVRLQTERDAVNKPLLRPGRAIRFAAMAALTALVFLAPAMAAQDDDAPHPAHIHAGTCAELGDVVYPLTDVAVAEGESSGPESALPVKVSETVVDAPLQEIIDGGHAINVHLSADEIGSYIACGDIGGVVNTGENDSDQELIIGLGELSDSGHSGVAWLGADGDQTHVAIMLLEPAEMASAGAESAQEASPATADASAEASAVSIKGFAFNPPEITVPAGGSVTWTNEDNAPHTATGLDRDVLQSGAIAFGESYTQAFDTAGTYEYFCEFHPNMEGSIVVQ
ncbi:MAG: putative plastocyanin-like protein [Thermomicrobiales bacterium]|nr:putative plastocyanin-like protein [Thermomicrobiales bacterium]